MNSLILGSQIAVGDAAEITNILLHAIGKEIKPATALKVGACDGVFDDLTWGWISGYGMNVLFIEPIPDRCEKLKEHCRHTLNDKATILQCAVSDKDGSIDMCVIPTEYMGKTTPNGLYVHPALYGMSSVWPPKNGLTGEHDGKVLEEVGQRVSVPCRTLQSILQEYSPSSIDLLSIDTEGHDWVVLKQFDFEKYRPYWIEVELANLSNEDRASAVSYLHSNGYHVYANGRDGYAVRADCVDWQN